MCTENCNACSQYWIQIGSNSLWQCPTAHYTINTSKVEWIGLLSFASSEILTWTLTNLGFPSGSAGKESASNVGDLDLIAGLGRSPGEGNIYPLQNYGLENSMDYTVTKSQTWLSLFLGASMVAQMVKSLPAVQETQIQSLGWEYPVGKEMTTHSSILDWRIPMDRGAWWATVHGVAKRQTWLNHFTFIFFSQLSTTLTICRENTSKQETEKMLS